MSAERQPSPIATITAPPSVEETSVTETGGALTRIYPTRSAEIPTAIPAISIPRRRLGVVASTALAAALGLGGTALAWQMFTGADRGPSAPPAEPSKASDTIKQPESKQDVGIVTNPPAEATTEAQKPPPTPEAKLIGNGAIMPAELSTTGVMREFEYQGQVYKLALYNLPDGTPITSPEDNYFVTGNVSVPFTGSYLSIFDPVDLTKPNLKLIGLLNIVSKLSRDVKKGEVVAYIQNTDEKMFGDYNFGLMVTAQKVGGTEFYSPNTPYKEYLPTNLPSREKIKWDLPIRFSSANVYLK